MAMPLGGILLLFLVLLAAAAAGGGGGVWAFSSSSSSSSYSRIGEQPLSLIGIHRATVGIDAAASVQASPRLLGVKVGTHSSLRPARRNPELRRWFAGRFRLSSARRCVWRGEERRRRVCAMNRTKFG